MFRRNKGIFKIYVRLIQYFSSCRRKLSSIQDNNTIQALNNIRILSYAFEIHSVAVIQTLVYKIVHRTMKNGRIRIAMIILEEEKKNQ